MMKPIRARNALERAAVLWGRAGIWSATLGEGVVQEGLWYYL